MRIRIEYHPRITKIVRTDRRYRERRERVAMGAVQAVGSAGKLLQGGADQFLDGHGGIVA